MAQGLLFTVALCLLSTFILVESQNVTPAPPCTDQIRYEECNLPECRCSGSDIPGNLTKEQTPQIVFLTFDDAVHSANFFFYEEVFGNRKNPNNQPVTITLFISHDYTNYSMVHELWRHGHEIALHSITHETLTSYWKTLNESMWNMELGDQRDQMSYFASIPKDDIKGMRAPFLQMGGDVMYKSLYSTDFEWESSRPSLAFRLNGLWPYTNDYASNQDCVIPPCAVGSYPGFWTVPMVDLVGENGQGCSMVDQCSPVPETQEDTYNLLYNNFQTQYKGSRSPFGVYTHAAWLNGTGNGDEIWERRRGYVQFLDYLATLDDVYIVGVSRGLEWVKNPTPLDKIKDFPAFQTEIKPSQCPITSNCRYVPGGVTEKWFRSCVLTCPNNYPWLGNPLGK